MKFNAEESLLFTDHAIARCFQMAIGPDAIIQALCREHFCQRGQTDGTWSSDQIRMMHVVELDGAIYKVIITDKTDNRLIITVEPLAIPEPPPQTAPTP